MKHLYKCLTAFLLVFALLTTTASFTGTVKAEGPDLGQTCSLRVSVGKHMEDLVDSSLEVQVIQVARAVEMEGYDAYAFEALDRFADIELNDIETSEEWREVAKEVAARALEKDGWDTAAGVARIEQTIPELDPGLYLVVPYDPENPGATVEVTDTDGNTSLATTYDTQTKTYTFTPSLVSLPTKEADADGVVNTAGGGEWIYDATINLKAEQESRLGKLEIVKSLTGYVSGSPATFVFRVYGTYWKEINGVNTELVAIDDVFAITFDGEPLTRSLVIDGIPAGALVTVTEIYSGTSYTIESDQEQIAIISAEDVTWVSFTNKPNDSAKGGGGIVNQFTFQEDGWELEQIPFGAASVADR